MLSFFIFLGIPIIAIIIFAIFSNSSNDLFYGSFISILILTLSLLFILTIQIDTSSRLNESISLQQTLNIQREKNSKSTELESISVYRNILDFNQNLAKEKYYNSIWILDCFINDNVARATPVK